MSKEILDNKVHVNKPWMLSQQAHACYAADNLDAVYRETRRPVYVICNAYHEGVIVGTAFVVGDTLHVYVKPKHRRKGLGSLLIKKVQRSTKQKDFHVYEGIRGSVSFYSKNNMF